MSPAVFQKSLGLALWALATNLLDAQAPDQRANGFIGASSSQKIELVATMSGDERQAVISELRRILAVGGFGKAPIIEALAYLGDNEALQQLVQEFIESDGDSSGLLAPMQNSGATSSIMRGF